MNSYWVKCQHGGGGAEIRTDYIEIPGHVSKDYNDAVSYYKISEFIQVKLDLFPRVIRLATGKIKLEGRERMIRL